MRIGEWFVSEGLITREQLKDALEGQEKSVEPLRIGEWLLKQQIIEDRDLIRGLAEQFHCDFITTIKDEMIDPDLVSNIPLEYARSRSLLPIRYKKSIGLLTSDPIAVVENTDLALLLGEEPIPVLATDRAIHAGIERCYFQRRESTRELLEGMDESEEVHRPDHDGGDLLRSSDQAPVTQFVNLMLLEALKADASDIHIEPYNRRLQIRFRIDGHLYDHTAPPKNMEASLISRLKIMARVDIAEKRLPQDGMAKVTVGEREVDVRVSTVPVAEGERMVLRLLRHDQELMSLADLGMSPRMLESFNRLLLEPNGVIWVTGPTGSGKTTTLYAALQCIDTRRKNVLTIEDPIEYQLPDIGQINVRPKIGLTFSQALRHVLRQDPDVILVGETRDDETAEIVVRASLTGHLVFSTLHTNDALSAVTRLVDMGVQRYLVAESSRAAIAQRLVRRLCSACKAPFEARDDAPESLRGKTIYRAVGCDACREGYAGRVGIYELIRIDAPLQEAIRRNAPLAELQTLARNQDSVSMREDGLEKVAAGATSLEELTAVIGTAGG